MQLINTDGMALIGPGSEWFWTALTGLILAITFFANYRQLGSRFRPGRPGIRSCWSVPSAFINQRWNPVVGEGSSAL